MVEILETTDEIDSFESRLLNWFEGLRGGRAGEGCDCIEAFLGGNLGGGVGLAEGLVACPVRVITGGGRMAARLGPSGSFPMPLLPE